MIKEEGSCYLVEMFEMEQKEMGVDVDKRKAGLGVDKDWSKTENLEIDNEQKEHKERKVVGTHIAPYFELTLQLESLVLRRWGMKTVMLTLVLR